jgi:hypothetical protein
MIDWGALQLLESTIDRPVSATDLAAFVSPLVGLEPREAPEPAERLALRTAGDRAAASSLLERVFAGWDVGGSFKDRAATVVDELVSNAVRDAGGRCELSLRRTDSELWVSTRDALGQLTREELFASIRRGLTASLGNTSSGGAGVGLYYVSWLGDGLRVDVRRQRSTEVCVRLNAQAPRRHSLTARFEG